MEVISDRGGWVVKYHATGAGRRGVPDLLACYRSIFLAVECKQPDGELHGRQHIELQNVRKAGGVSIIAYSATDVERAMTRIDLGWGVAGIGALMIPQTELPEPKVVML